MPTAGFILRYSGKRKQFITLPCLSGHFRQRDRASCRRRHVRRLISKAVKLLCGRLTCRHATTLRSPLWSARRAVSSPFRRSFPVWFLLRQNCLESLRTEVWVVAAQLANKTILPVHRPIPWPASGTLPISRPRSVEQKVNRHINCVILSCAQYKKETNYA